MISTPTMGAEAFGALLDALVDLSRDAQQIVVLDQHSFYDMTPASQTCEWTVGLSNTGLSSVDWEEGVVFQASIRQRDAKVTIGYTDRDQAQTAAASVPPGSAQVIAVVGRG